MEAIVPTYGGPEVLTTRPCSCTPDQVQLQEGEVLVKNAYAGVNFMDAYFREGYIPHPSLPFVPGSEGAGVVVKVGAGVPETLVGRRVGYFCFLGGPGSYAAYTVAKSAAVFEVPDGVTDQEVAATMISGFTAHYLTDASYHCGPESTVVVHAAAGGTGLLVCQMAKLRGARVIGVCGGAAKAELAKTVGRADVVIDHTATPDWAAAVRAVAPAQGVDAVYDGVGGATWAGSLSLLRKQGYMISYGNASGPMEPIDPMALLRSGSIYLQRPSMYDYVDDHELASRRYAEVFEWIASKQLPVQVGHVYPLSEVGKANADLESRRSTGKLLIQCTADA